MFKRFNVAFSLIVLAIVIPGALFGWTAWQDRARVLKNAEASALRTSHALHEHGLRVLETGELLLRHMDRRLAGRDWSDIEGDQAMQTEFAELVKAAPGVTGALIADAAGQVRASGGAVPARKYSIADRDYFRAARDGSRGLVIGSTRVGQTSGVAVVPLAIARSSESGAFAGVITVGLSLEYFTDFWKQFAPTVNHVIPLMRADGELLVRHPALRNPQRLDPNGPFMQQIRRSPSGLYTAVSKVDGIERLNAYTRIGHYPLYISFSVETAALLAEWRRDVAFHAGVTLLAMAALLALSAVVIRQTRREREAADRWRETAGRLESEMARRKAAEGSLRQAQKMEIIGQISGGVAHDFNNLLQILSTNLYMAERKLGEPEGAGGFIRDAMQAAERGAGLTAQLLAFSRRQPLAPRPVETAAMLAELNPLLRTTVGGAIEVAISPSADTWPVMVDHNQAEMALLNLAVNARDAMPRGGKLTISTRNVRIGPAEGATLEVQPGEYVVIGVQDTGTGMAPDVAKHAFDPFFTTKQAGKGSGLGLSQVQGFAAQSGGTATLQSTQGVGTTVELYLPKARAPVQRQPAATTRPHMPGGASVLLVDDDALVRQTVAAGLAMLGYEVLQAESGAEALEVLARDPGIQVLITDYAMPGMRGNELARLAGRLAPHLKVILVSGFTDLAESEEQRWNVLRKPFSPQQLAARIDEVLHGGPNANRKVA